MKYGNKKKIYYVIIVVITGVGLFMPFFTSIKFESKKENVMMEIKKICVVGGGLMGRQIALCASIKGFDATVYDLKTEVLDAVQAWEDEYLAGRIAKGRMTEEQVAATRARFHLESSLEKAVEGVDCVIECIVEIQEVKANLFRQIDQLVGKDVIIATNSSNMVSSLFADCVSNPSRLCNMHFYNPALVMEFVEVVQGPHTSEETAGAAYEFCKAIGKCPIWMKKELPGFAGNYLMAGLQQRARYMVQNGYCTPQEVDIALEKGFNHKMGVFRMNDLTGIDLTYTILKGIYEKTGEKPDMYDIYEQMFKEGKLGRKSGHGFYDYE